MSLSQLNTAAASDSGVAIDILNPKTGLPLGFQFILCGTDSKTYRDVIRRQQNRRFEQVKQSRGQSVITAEAIEAESLDVLVACTKGWQMVDADGKVKQQTIELEEGEFADCTPEKVREVYADPGYGWLREQIDRAIGDRANFLGQ